MPHIYVTDDSLVHVVDGLYEFSRDPSRGLPPVCDGWELSHYYWVGGGVHTVPASLEAEVSRYASRGLALPPDRLPVYWSDTPPTCFVCMVRWLRRI